MIETPPAPDTVTDTIRRGKALPLADRQARWDRIQAWAKLFSLAEMRELEFKESGILLTRERIRAIKDNPRPGSVGRPKLKGLLSKRADIRRRLRVWKKRTGSMADTMEVRLTQELVDTEAEIKAEQHRQRAIERR